MKLTNYTKVPDPVLREMIRFATPPGVSGYDITFKNDGSGQLHGRAYYMGCDYHRRNGKCPPLITIHVPKWFGPVDRRIRRNLGTRKGRAIERRSCRGYMPCDAWTHHEELIHIIAHELRHLWQAKAKGKRARGMVWGGRGRFSEKDADAYGIRITRAWRRR